MFFVNFTGTRRCACDSGGCTAQTRRGRHYCAGRSGSGGTNCRSGCWRQDH